MRVRTTVCFNKQASRLSSGREPAYQCSRLERHRFNPQSKDLLEKALAHSLLAWRIPWTERVSWRTGSHRVRQTLKWLGKHTLPSHCWDVTFLSLQIQLVLKVSRANPEQGKTDTIRCTSKPEVFLREELAWHGRRFYYWWKQTTEKQNNKQT